MYSSFRIRGFRRFQKLEISDLRRVNLLVGRNNSGKTSVLEALSILFDPSSLVDHSLRRGEILIAEDEQDRELRTQFREELDVSCLFSGYGDQPEANVSFGLVGAGTWNHQLTASKSSGPTPALGLQLDDLPEVLLSLSEQDALPLWEVSQTIARRARLRFPQRNPEDIGPMTFVEPGGYSAAKLAGFLGGALLTPEEDWLLDALRLVEPSVRRIAILPDALQSSTRSQKQGIIVLCEGKRRLPLGNLGDGVWRLLMIALALVSSARGIVLIDEIDTGLHHTVLEGMWRLLLKTAARLDVQVFATTHSDDCWKALARVLEEEDGALDGEVSLQRLEAGNPETVIFPGNLIRIANQNKIEVR